MAGYLLIDRKRAGFTLFEICVALVILAVAVLGISASAGQARIAERGRREPRGSARGGERPPVTDPAEPELRGVGQRVHEHRARQPQVGMTRVTDLVRTRTAMPNGQFIDYTTITVTVSGPEVTPAISRSLIVGAR